MDLGAPGAHARASRVSIAAIRGPGRGGHSLRAMPSACPRDGRRRRSGNAQSDRSGERRRRSVESQICRRRTDRHRIHRPISAAHSCGADTRYSRHLTTQVLDRAWRLGLLKAEDAEVLRRAVRLYHDLTQILRLCLPGDFDPKAAAPELSGLLTRAADVPDFATLDAFIGET